MTLQHLLELPTDKLFERLGTELSESEIGLSFPSLREKKDYAKKWFVDRIELFRKGVCNNEELKKTVSANFDEIEIISAIADLISSYCVNSSPFTVSVLLYKYGILKLCSGIWEIK